MPGATATGRPRAAIACAASIRSVALPRAAHRHAAKLGPEVSGVIDARHELKVRSRKSRRSCDPGFR